MNTDTQRTAPRRAPQAQRSTVPVSDGLADLQRLAMRDIRALARMSESKIREMMARGEFPQPDYRDGPRCVRWNAGTVRRWLESTTAQS